MSPGLILASRSPARAALLTAAGVDFKIASADVDEAEIKDRLLAQATAPRAIAQALAVEKAVAVSRLNEGLVIGADQTLELDGVLFDKADGLAQARQQLSMLRGRRHQLHAAVAAVERGAVIWSQVSTASLSMRGFSDGFLDDYLGRNGARLLSCVGGYELEGEGVQLFDQIDGDYFAILGLPMLGLLSLLRDRGLIGC